MSDHEPIPNGHHRCPSVAGRFVPDPDCGRDEYGVSHAAGPRPSPLALPARTPSARPAVVIDLNAYREARV